MAQGAIVNRMRRIQSQGINVKLLERIKRVRDKELAHRPAIGPVEVDRLAPRRAVATGEVRPELPEVVTFGPKMVVNDVEDDRELPRVTGVDEPLQPLRPTISVLRREGMD